MASSETERLSNLVAQLREVYRPRQDGQVKPVKILSLLEEVHNLLRTHLRDRYVQWTQNPGSITVPSSLYVSGISDQLKQVFLNISMNAIEAMAPDGGGLTVDLISSKEGHEVGIRFQDTGPGIPAEEISRLFEPFYTTKTKGLGLGLSICYDIVQRHGGNITAESQPGQGAIFTVWLPLINAEHPVVS
jgi:signal transduction histidine kinase